MWKEIKERLQHNKSRLGRLKRLTTELKAQRLIRYVIPWWWEWVDDLSSPIALHFVCHPIAEKAQ